jgi:seryl-tRNA(Sec) selenium transferase
LDLAALEATLEIYLSGSLEELPIYFQMSVGEDFLQARAQRIVHELKKDHWLCEIEKGFAEVGGGTLPAGSLPTWVVKVEPSSWPGGAQGLAYALRMQTPPVLVRIVHNQIHCDVRTLLAGEEEILCRLFHSLRENEKITDKQTNWGISEID